MAQFKLILLKYWAIFFRPFYWMLETFIVPVWLGACRLCKFIWPTRFSFLTICVGGIILLKTAQGEELTASVGEGGGAWFGWFVLAVLWLAIQSWYWARAVLPVPNMPSRPMSSEETAHQDDKILFWKEWLPRVYAGSTFVLATIALYQQGLYAFSFIMAGVGIATLSILIMRRPVWNKVSAQHLDTNGIDKSATLTSSMVSKNVAVNLDWIMWISSFLIATISLVSFTLEPIKLGQFFGATAIAFFAFGNVIPIGNYLVKRSNDIGLPVLTLIALCAAASSYSNDNHAIPTLRKPVERFNVEQAVEKWLRVNSKGGRKTIPLVLVSTAGGGLRAAYWTASVLGNLEDKCPNFRDHTFAISSVSGGALGAAVYAARSSLNQKSVEPTYLERCRSDSEMKIDLKPVTKFSTSVLNKDFLGPTLATMLFPDFVQRLLPFDLFPSRGTTLSTAWSMSWKDKCEEDETCRRAEANKIFDEAFLGIGPKKNEGWSPALLFNSTHQETGKRYITSHLKITRDVFFDAFDGHHVLKRDVSLTTAVLNSARFTYVSPAGLLQDPAGKKIGHILDGGYFENSGAVTTSELFLKLLEVLENQLKSEEYRGIKIQPIVIQITSDPSQSPDDFATTGTKDSFLEMRTGRDRGLNELLAPILGILKTRTARGVLASKTMAEIVDLLALEEDGKSQWFKKIENPQFANFEMCIDETQGEEAPPLGWTMAKKSRDVISKMHSRKIAGSISGKNSGSEIPWVCDNEKQFSIVVNALQNVAN